MSSSNKPLAIGLAAAAVFVGGALLFNYFQSKQSSSAASNEAVLADIDSLGPPKREANGLLAFGYFKELMQTVQRHGKERFASDKKEFLFRRRHLLQENKLDEYKEVVAEMVKKEEACFQDLMMEVVDHIGLTEQEFMQTNQIYMSNPQTSQLIMQAQMMPQTPAGEEVQAPKLTRQRTKEIFMYSEEKKMDKMKSMMESARMQGGMGEDPMEGMMEMMVEQCKLSDEIFFKYNVDDDEFNFAMMRHNLLNDPEIQRTMMMNMQKLGINPAMMGGGMGGGY